MSNLNSEMDSTPDSTPAQTTDLQATKAESEEPSFTLFPKLPSELRLKIMKMAINRPRVLPIQYIDNESPRHFNDRLSIQVPAVLHVNQEFRTEALKSYKLTFTGSPRQRGSDHSMIYYNPNTDVVYFDDDAWVYYVRLDASFRRILGLDELLGKIMIVGFRPRRLYSPHDYDQSHRDFFSNFPVLRSVVVIERLEYPATFNMYTYPSDPPSWEDLEPMDFVIPEAGAIFRQVGAQKEIFGDKDPEMLMMLWDEQKVRNDSEE